MRSLAGKPVIIRVALVFFGLTLIWAIRSGSINSALFMASSVNFGFVFSYILFSWIRRDLEKVSLFKRDVLYSIPIALLFGLMTFFFAYSTELLGGDGVFGLIAFLVFFFVGYSVVQKGEMMFFPILPIEEFD